jgi:hypothetical protein
MPLRRSDPEQVLFVMVRSRGKIKGEVKSTVRDPPMTRRRRAHIPPPVFITHFHQPFTACRDTLPLQVAAKSLADT